MVGKRLRKELDSVLKRKQKSSEPESLRRKIKRKRKPLDTSGIELKIPREEGFGNPKAFTKEIMIEAILESRGNLQRTADLLECCRITVHRYVFEYYDLKEVVKNGKSIIRDMAKSNIERAIEAGDIEVSKWYAERICKSEGFSLRQEITGPEGTPLLPEERIKKLTDNEIDLELTNRMKAMLEDKQN